MIKTPNTWIASSHSINVILGNSPENRNETFLMRNVVDWVSSPYFLVSLCFVDCTVPFDGKLSYEAMSSKETIQYEKKKHLNYCGWLDVYERERERTLCST